MVTPTYQYYNEIFKNLQLPVAYCDINLLDKNIQDITVRASGDQSDQTQGNKTIRIASKSVRCSYILKRILDSNPIYKGIMCFSGGEALFLSEQGFDDLLLGYPIVNKEEIKDICTAVKNGKKIILMVDCEEHLQLINNIAKQANVIQPLCIDIDMSTDFPGIHFGVMRSPLTTVAAAKRLVDYFDKYENIKLTGVMGYEAQVAGLGEKNPANGIKNLVIPFLKKDLLQILHKEEKKLFNI